MTTCPDRKKNTFVIHCFLQCEKPHRQEESAISDWAVDNRLLITALGCISHKQNGKKLFGTIWHQSAGIHQHGQREKRHQLVGLES